MPVLSSQPGPVCHLKKKILTNKAEEVTEG